MLALSDTQLSDVQTAAAQLPRRLRSAFLERLAHELGGRDVGDGEMHRIAHRIARELATEPPRARPAPERDAEKASGGAAGYRRRPVASHAFVRSSR